METKHTLGEIIDRVDEAKELARLRAENARLREALTENDGVMWDIQVRTKLLNKGIAVARFDMGLFDRMRDAHDTTRAALKVTP